MWRVFYLAVFLAGLALAVHVMLHGIERWRLRRSAKPSAVLNPPTVAALAVGFGMSGYLFNTRSAFGPVVVLLISCIFGIAFLSGMVVLMAKWALKHTESSLPEEDVNGQVATVTGAIGPGEPGVIEWFAWGRKHLLAAKSLDGSAISAGTEVVIDVVEDGVASVEPWSVVESRL